MNAVVKFGSISPDKQSIETLRVVGNDARHHFIMNETNKGRQKERKRGRNKTRERKKEALAWNEIE